VIWGTSDEHIVWGDLDLEHIVWGDHDEHIVWGDSGLVSTLSTVLGF
jgi:hypothetical protein